VTQNCIISALKTGMKMKKGMRTSNGSVALSSPHHTFTFTAGAGRAGSALCSLSSLLCLCSLLTTAYSLQLVQTCLMLLKAVDAGVVVAPNLYC